MYPLLAFIVAPVCHFLLSASVGLIAYLAVMAVFRKFCFSSMKAEDISRVQFFLLCLCLSLAIMAHVVEDYTIDLF